MRFIVMFVTAVCVLFLIKLRWPKKKSIYDIVYPRSKDENEQQTQPTYDTGPELNPGHIAGRRAQPRSQGLFPGLGAGQGLSRPAPKPGKRPRERG